MAEAPTTEADTICVTPEIAFGMGLWITTSAPTRTEACVTPEIAFGMGLWITTSAPTRTEAEIFKGKKRRQKITKDMNT